MTSDAAPARPPIDRSTLERSAPALMEDALHDPATRVLDLRDACAHVAEVAPRGTDSGRAELVLRAPRPDDVGRDAFFLGRDGARRAVVAVVSAASDESEAAAFEAVADGDVRATRRSLRDVGAALDACDVDLYLTAVALANWHATHRFCPRCGASTRIVDGGWVRRCDADGSQHFPRTDPAVIMAVTDPDDRLLLARNPAWPAGRRSVLAGFVEPGERLEAAVVREVAEEVGVVVDTVAYSDSQPWPFPASLMLGFTARCSDPTLRLSPDEIAEAEWYSRADLEAAVADGSLGLPGRLSIARRLIETWFGQSLTPPTEVAFHRA